jgi:hypothetical protein
VGRSLDREFHWCCILFVSILFTLQSSIVVGRLAGGVVSDRDRPGLGEGECRTVDQAAAFPSAQCEEGKHVYSCALFGPELRRCMLPNVSASDIEVCVVFATWGGGVADVVVPLLLQD